MGNTYLNHKGNYYYNNHTLYHIGTLDPLGVLKMLGFKPSPKAFERLVVVVQSSQLPYEL